MRRREAGARGEDAACALLEQEGYTILARNFHSRYGEIDIIAQCGEITAFVEVKARESVQYGLPCEAVTPRKQEKIIQTAYVWLQAHDPGGMYRFDVVEVLLTAGRPTGIRHLPDAFRPA